MHTCISLLLKSCRFTFLLISILPNKIISVSFYKKKRGSKSHCIFVSKKICHMISIWSVCLHIIIILAISQVLTKALCFYARQNGLTALFGSYRKCYRWNKFHEKITWNVDDMYFVLETFLTSLVFFTLCIISENKETPNNITVSICLAFKEKIHNWDL